MLEFCVANVKVSNEIANAVIFEFFSNAHTITLLCFHFQFEFFICITLSE